MKDLPAGSLRSSTSNLDTKTVLFKPAGCAPSSSTVREDRMVKLSRDCRQSVANASGWSSSATGSTVREKRFIWSEAVAAVLISMLKLVTGFDMAGDRARTTARYGASSRPPTTVPGPATRRMYGANVSLKAVPVRVTSSVSVVAVGVCQAVALDVSDGMVLPVPVLVLLAVVVPLGGGDSVGDTLIDCDATPDVDAVPDVVRLAVPVAVAVTV